MAHDRLVDVLDERIPVLALSKNAGADTGSAEVFFALEDPELDVEHSVVEKQIGLSRYKLFCHRCLSVVFPKTTFRAVRYHLHEVLSLLKRFARVPVPFTQSTRSTRSTQSLIKRLLENDLKVKLRVLRVPCVLCVNGTGTCTECFV